MGHYKTEKKEKQIKELRQVFRNKNIFEDCSHDSFSDETINEVISLIGKIKSDGSYDIDSGDGLILNLFNGKATISDAI